MILLMKLIRSSKIFINLIKIFDENIFLYFLYFSFSFSIFFFFRYLLYVDVIFINSSRELLLKILSLFDMNFRINYEATFWIKNLNLIYLNCDFCEFFYNSFIMIITYSISRNNYVKRVLKRM